LSRLSTYYAVKIESVTNFIVSMWRLTVADVLGPRASVQPLGSWMLMLLVALVIFLTIEHAPGSLERAQSGLNTSSNGVVSVETGFLTIASVTVIAIFVAFEPKLSRWIEGIVGGNTRLGLHKEQRAKRWLFIVIYKSAVVVWRAPSIAINLIDFLLARPIAFFAGATQKSTKRRYIWGAFIVVAAISVGLFATPTYGLIAVTVGLLAIVGTVRRWSWVEADREVFLIERGSRVGAHQIGFTEDLRDEALVGLVFVFVLIPIGLHQIQNVTCEINQASCAFDLNGTSELARNTAAQFGAWFSYFGYDSFGRSFENTIRQFLEWIGYFGAELAKSVPFVDWSEVFHVSNASPITPKTPLGAQVVFFMRATLDLLLLAAVIQAVQIAGRIKDKNAAFNANRLPILEPFTETQELKRVETRIVEEFGLRTIDQPSINTFPNYDFERLRELVSDTEIDLSIRKMAVALIARQYRSHSEASVFLTLQARAESNLELRGWIYDLAGGVVPAVTKQDGNARGQKLADILLNHNLNDAYRSTAARALGRFGCEQFAGQLLDVLKNHRESHHLRADCGVALSKFDVDGALPTLENLASKTPAGTKGRALTPALSIAFALAHYRSDDLDHVTGVFDESLHSHILRAASIHRISNSTHAKPVVAEGRKLDQITCISPGHNGFPDSFVMGANPGDRRTKQNELPPHPVTMTRAFAIGVYPVTQEEYLGYCNATGKSALNLSEDLNHPVAWASFFDALDYCEWLSEITGEIYRLPSEAEWEYSCRAGTQDAYWWGNRFDKRRSNSNSSGIKSATRVGSYKPSPWGLYDMHGNMFEWCLDPHHENYNDAPNNGEQWLDDGNLSLRINRGGSWFSDPYTHRAAYRGSFDPTNRSMHIGFRIARELII